MTSRKSSGSTSSSPRALRISLYAERRKYAFDDAGDLDRILEREEDALLRALLGIHLEQILAVVVHLAAGDLVRRVSGEHLRERALAGPVRPHDRVHLAGVHREADAAKDWLIANAGVKISDL